MARREGLVVMLLDERVDVLGEEEVGENENNDDEQYERQDGPGEQRRVHRRHCAVHLDSELRHQVTEAEAKPIYER